MQTTSKEVIETIRGYVKQVLPIPGDIPLFKGFAYMGLDSLGRVELQNLIMEKYHLDYSLSEFNTYPTVLQLSHNICQQLAIPWEE